MTTAATISTFDPALLAFLDEHDVRYEVIDGSLVVTPPATFSHENLVARLIGPLVAGAPADIAVVGSSYGFYYEPGSFLMADVTVARREDCRESGIYVAPLLVVEVLSPSTRRRDVTRKREIYEEAGVPSYWVVDPEAATLTVLELEQGRYVQALCAPLTEAATVARPFALTLTVLPTPG